MTKFSVPDMSCGHCKAAIEKALGELDPKARVEVDLEHKQVEVEGSADVPAILATLKDAGYPATVQN